MILSGARACLGSRADVRVEDYLDRVDRCLPGVVSDAGWVLHGAGTTQLEKLIPPRHQRTAPGRRSPVNITPGAVLRVNAARGGARPHPMGDGRRVGHRVKAGDRAWTR